LRRLLYTLALHALIPFALAHLAWRARRQPEYLRHVGERFGRYAFRADRPVLWLHTVSVGETRAAQPLVAALLERHPECRVLLTHTTPTGRATSEELFGDRVLRAYLPYDLPWAVDGFVKTFRPRVGILMETELWPHLIRRATRAGTPMLLVNARLSERSAKGYRRFGDLARGALEDLACVAAQTADDAARLADLGARDVAVMGNLKFDVTPPAAMLERGDALRATIGRTRPVLLAASTREGEEALVLDAFARIDAPDALLLLVPRHPQRFDEVARLVASRGLAMQRRSEAQTVLPETRVLLGDTMGEMFAYFRAADVAFVGGSLVPTGGQNLIEACATGTPVLIGPHTFNFAEATTQAIAAGAAERVDDADGLGAAGNRLLRDIDARTSMAAAGQRFAAAHRGATDRALNFVEAVLSRPR
jgi:3-deoxy-D-manno-octulosonic-acid transferase